MKIEKHFQRFFKKKKLSLSSPRLPHRFPCRAFSPMPLRRRTTSTTSAEPTSHALTAPLLAPREENDGDDGDDDDDDDALALASSSSSASSSFAELLFSLVTAPVSAALSILAPLIPLHWRPLHLSPKAQRALDALRTDASVPFDPNSKEHSKDLERLWAASFGERIPFPANGRSPRWKEVGWQGEDPRTDLRGGGRGALTAALHMKTQDPRLWDRLLEKKGRGSSDWLAPEGLEYPFGAAGVNVAFMVSQVAGLHSHDAESGAAAAAAAAAAASVAGSSSSSASAAAASSAALAAGSASRDGRGRGPAPSQGPPRTAAAKGFAALLAASVPEEGGGEVSPSLAGNENDHKNGNDDKDEEDPHSVALRLRAWSVFGDVYCAAFEALDDEWCSRKASYLEFPAVMAATRSKLERALSSRRARDSKEGLREELRRQ
jgi:hypothetical protein